MGNRKENRTHVSREKKEEGFEKEKVTPSKEPKKQQTPSEEVPNVGDHEKQGPKVNPSYKESTDRNNDKEGSLGEIVGQIKVEAEKKAAKK